MCLKAKSTKNLLFCLECVVEHAKGMENQPRPCCVAPLHTALIGNLNVNFVSHFEENIKSIFFPCVKC